MNKKTRSNEKSATSINNLDEISQYYLLFESFTKLQNIYIEKLHQKKYDNLFIEKHLQDSIQQNPSKIMTNLTNINLSNEEISVSELGLYSCDPRNQK